MTSPSHASPAPGAANSSRPTALPAALLFALVFVEGFVSLGAEILTLRRLLPHLGSANAKTRDAMGDRALDNIDAALAGKPMPFPAG